jgi:hypothetical protein
MKLMACGDANQNIGDSLACYDIELHTDLGTFGIADPDSPGAQHRPAQWQPYRATVE